MKVTSKHWGQYLKQFSVLIFDPLTTAHMKILLFLDVTPYVVIDTEVSGNPLPASSG